MKLTVRHHLFKIFEPGKGKRYEVISAFTPTEAQEKVMKAWPDCKALLIDSRDLNESFQ